MDSGSSLATQSAGCAVGHGAFAARLVRNSCATLLRRRRSLRQRSHLNHRRSRRRRRRSQSDRAVPIRFESAHLAARSPGRQSRSVFDLRTLRRHTRDSLEEQTHKLEAGSRLHDDGQRGFRRKPMCVRFAPNCEWIARCSAGRPEMSDRVGKSGRRVKFNCWRSFPVLNKHHNSNSNNNKWRRHRRFVAPMFG